MDFRDEVISASWILSIGLEVRRQFVSSLFIFAISRGTDSSVSPFS